MCGVACCRLTEASRSHIAAAQRADMSQASEEQDSSGEESEEEEAIHVRPSKIRKLLTSSDDESGCDGSDSVSEASVKELSSGQLDMCSRPVSSAVSRSGTGTVIENEIVKEGDSERATQQASQQAREQESQRARESGKMRERESARAKDREQESKRVNERDSEIEKTRARESTRARDKRVREREIRDRDRRETGSAEPAGVKSRNQQLRSAALPPASALRLKHSAANRGAMMQRKGVITGTRTQPLNRTE